MASVSSLLQSFFTESIALIQQKGAAGGATALSLGFSIATFNKREFDRIEGLEVELLPS